MQHDLTLWDLADEKSERTPSQYDDAVVDALRRSERSTRTQLQEIVEGVPSTYVPVRLSGPRQGCVVHLQPESISEIVMR